MSRAIGRREVAVTRIDLGECRCPGTPHRNDWADVVDRFNFGGVRAVAAAVARQIFDPTLYKAVAVAQGVYRWNLVDVDDRGQVPLEITIESLDIMDDRQAALLVAHFDQDPSVYADQLRAFRGEKPEVGEPGVPLPSVAPSPDGSEVTSALDSSMAAVSSSEATIATSSPDPSPSSSATSSPES